MRCSAFVCVLVAASTLGGTLACFASSPITTLLKSAEQQAAAPAAAEILPPIREPQPYRQKVTGNCELSPPAPAGVCRFAFDQIPANRLLEMTNVNCFSVFNEGGPFALTKSANFTKFFSSMFAAVPRQAGSYVGIAAGPFFMMAGERLIIWGDGSPGTGAFCTIQGQLYRTD
jgi:hypothetical protein